MTTTDPSGIPTGPIDHEPTAAYDDDGRFKDATAREVILRDALAQAGVELGVYDDRIVAWFAQFADWSTFATMTSWISRAGRAEDDQEDDVD